MNCDKKMSNSLRLASFILVINTKTKEILQMDKIFCLQYFEKAFIMLLKNKQSIVLRR